MQYIKGADPVDSRTQRACEYILEHSRNSESRGFAYTQSTKTGRGLASGVIPCLTGNMVCSLIKLGYVHNERLQKAIHHKRDRHRQGRQFQTIKPLRNFPADKFPVPVMQVSNVGI